MLKNIIIISFYLILFGCGNIKNNQIIDNEQKFNFKSQVNLYSNEEKKIIKKFFSFSNHENLARQNVKYICSKFIITNNLEDINCKYMGTKLTEKILTSLN